jgi:hypothetical protein
MNQKSSIERVAQAIGECAVAACVAKERALYRCNRRDADQTPRGWSGPRLKAQVTKLDAVADGAGPCARGGPGARRSHCVEEGILKSARDINGGLANVQAAVASDERCSPEKFKTALRNFRGTGGL